MKKISLFIMLVLSIAFLVLLSSCDEANGECKHEKMVTSVVEADCDGEGYTLHKCRECKLEYKTDIVAAKGHTLSGELVSPTCTKQGYTIFSCHCGYSYKTDHVAPNGHAMNTEKHLPSCTHEGYTRYYCHCGYSFKSDFAPPKGHTISHKTETPTCTEEGYTRYTCTVCAYTYLSDYVVPKGHDFTTKVSHPTSSKTGYTEFNCDCGYHYVGDYVMSSDIFKGAYVDGVEVLAHGIDISSWNGTINWTEIKAAGIDYVIIKAGSTNGKDKTFEENYKNAKAAGLGVGCYYYTYATTVEQISADADNLMEWIAGKQFDYPVYLDIEDKSQEALDGELLTEMCKVFIEKLQANKYFCGLYTNNNWLVNLLNTEKITVYFDVWLARWTLSGEPNWGDSFGQRMGMWQYTDKGKIGTHSCDFDLNVSFKDYPTLIKELGYNGY